MKVLALCSLYGDAFFKSLIDGISVDTTVYYGRRKDKFFVNNDKKVISEKVYSKIDGILYFSKEKKLIKNLEKNLNCEKFSIIHAHTLYTDGFLAYQIFKKNSTPYIVAVRSTDLLYYAKYRKDLYFLAKKILINAKKVVFLSENYLNRTSNHFKINLKNKSVVIPNGLDNFFIKNLYCSDSSKKDNNNCFNLITVGFISKRKNQLTVAKAISELRLEYNLNIRYSIIGKVLDQSILTELEKFPFVEYKSFMSKENLINEYRRSDLFIMPSLNETFGLTYLEAISQNTPVIYSSGEGFDGQFVNGEVGYPVDPLDIEDIKKKILLVLYNESKFEMISKKSKNFSWEIIGEKYRNIYYEVLDE